MELLERLRAARLHRQRSAPDLDALVGGSVGLHSTDYATPYLSAWARIPGFDAAATHARLQSGDGLVRLNAMRNTVHVVRAADFAAISAATGAAVAAVGRKQPGLKERSDAEIDAGVDALCAALEGGPRTTNALKEALPAQAEGLRSWLLVAMGRGEVVRADAPTPRSNRCRYALVRDRVPGAPKVPPADARRDLLRRAVGAFGPLTVEDLAWWLPAPKGEVTRALAGAGFATLEAEGRRFWYAPELADAPAPPRAGLGAWLLPYEDALWKATLDRSAWLAPGLRDVIFPQLVTHWQPPDGRAPGPGPHSGVRVSGEARPSIWWGGRAVGRWEERGREPIAWQLHADVGAEGRRAVAAEVDRLGGFLVAAGLV